MNVRLQAVAGSGGSVPLAPASGSVPQPAAAALRLLHHEAEVRRLQTEDELLFHLVNDVRGLLPYGGALLLRRQRSSGRLSIGRVADLPDADREAPLLRALTARIERLQRQTGGLAEAIAFQAVDAAADSLECGGAASAAPPASDTALLADYPFRHLLWLPLNNRLQAAGSVDAGVVYARAEPFTAGERTLLIRLADTYAHAWAALPVRRRFASGLAIGRRGAGVAALALLALAALPVRLSVMAPVEVVAAEPFVVTAPIAGVVKRILVAPDSAVTAGQPLLQFEDIQPRNEMVLAEQRLAVARARDARTGAAAFRDATAAHDMAAARAELNLARVSHDYAVEVLARTQVRAPADGVAIYTDRRDWEGRAVMVGEEILQVADPARVALRVDLSTANSIELAAGGELSVYLDNAPLGGLKARLRSVSHTPRAQPDGSTSYTVLADPESEAGAAAGTESATDPLSGSASAATPGSADKPAQPPLPRIGARGTARLYGERVPLAFQLLRRPIAAARQFIGL